MKILLRIITILFAASIIAGSLTLIVNNTSLIADGPGGSEGQRLNNTEGNRQPPSSEGFQHGDENSSVGSGLPEILVTFTKLAGISAIVLLLKQGGSLLSRRVAHSKHTFS